jgi:hypothetical protein
MVEEIVKELKTPEGKTGSVVASRVQEWMDRQDAETLGATYVFLSKPEHVQRIAPPLPFDVVFDFVSKYYEFCLTTNPQSRWANSSFSAGADLVAPAPILDSRV